jgi:hypothetical protein
MSQYIPDVSEHDVERIVERDFPADAQDAIHEMIRGAEVREKTRVVLACLKNAKGSLDRLRSELASAGGYWREIISEAESPNYTKKMFRIDKLSADEQERIIEKDKNQYLAWLRGAGREKRNEA